VAERKLSLQEIVNNIIQILDQGINIVGFVSPSHVIPQMKTIIHELHNQKRFPVIVFNTNAYDKVDTIKSLEGLIDIYLPDLKYMDASIAKEYSDAKDYPEVATKSIKEMFRQKGSRLEMDDDGNAKSGLIVRHLVLPGNVENSIAVLRFIANELSPDVHLSLMSQYYPSPVVEKHPILGRPITKKEYDCVIDEMDKLGFHRGWVQEMESTEFYKPDFTKKNPFEN
jgi:putative pyruvate formate lyase activating enzyme